MMSTSRSRLSTIVALLALAAAGSAAAQDKGDAVDKLFERLLYRADSDGDGALGAAEGEAMAGRMFEHRDADGDAVLTRDEFMATKGGRPSADQKAKLEAVRARRFADMDKSGDGQVSAEEYVAAARGRFDAADANSDRRVTMEELRTLRDGL
ncbi:MAG: EF-hand domain-containing protein [Dongiaceae bacterium]